MLGLFTIHIVFKCSILNLVPEPLESTLYYALTIYTVLVLSKLKKLNATAPQPQRNVLKYFAIFKNVAHSLELGGSGSKLCTLFLNLAKHDEILSKNQFTGTATQPQRNHKFCQFNKDQYCNISYI